MGPLGHSGSGRAPLTETTGLQCDSRVVAAPHPLVELPQLRALLVVAEFNVSEQRYGSNLALSWGAGPGVVGAPSVPTMKPNRWQSSPTSFLPWSSLCRPQHIKEETSLMVRLPQGTPSRILLGSLLSSRLGPRGMARRQVSLDLWCEQLPDGTFRLPDTPITL